MEPSDRKSYLYIMILFIITKHLIQHKEGMLGGIEQHVPRVCILTLGSLNFTIHFKEPDSSDRRKIEYCSGNERD